MVHVHVLAAEELHAPLNLKDPSLMLLAHSDVSVWALLPQPGLPRHFGIPWGNCSSTPGSWESCACLIMLQRVVTSIGQRFKWISGRNWPCLQTLASLSPQLVLWNWRWLWLCLVKAWYHSVWYGDQRNQLWSSHTDTRPCWWLGCISKVAQTSGVDGVCTLLYPHWQPRCRQYRQKPVLDHYRLCPTPARRPKQHSKTQKAFLKPWRVQKV